MTLIVGIPACNKTLREPIHATPTRYQTAILATAGAIPILLPPIGDAILPILDRLDGLVLSGSPSNVEPTRYGVGESLTPGKHDPERDATTLPLIRAALSRGMPVLAICRGIQELNVALGGTLHQQVQTLPGRMDHRAGPIDPGVELDHLFRLKHPIRATGAFARLAGAEQFLVNSLHEQAIDRPADGIVVEATAEDGTIEAVRVASAPGWAFGVQFHPEWHHATDAPSRAIFQSFGQACAAYAQGLKKAA